MESLQMLKFSIKHGYSLSFTEGEGPTNVKEELENLAQDTPEDLTSYVASLQ